VTSLLTSPQSSLGVGWVFWAAVPFVVLAAAVSGLVVGTLSPTRRSHYSTNDPWTMQAVRGCD
jgi:branched-chain amino acid transport system permease protein